MFAHTRGRRVAAAIGAGVLAVAISGCSGASGSATPADTINVVVLSDANTDPSLQAVFDAYEESHPGKKINPVPIPLTTWPDFLSVLQTRLTGGADYDAVYLPTEGQLTMSSRGVLKPLDEYIAKDDAFMKDYYADLPPAMLEKFSAKETVGGKTYFVPHLVNTMGIWYNQKVFQAAGLTDPAPDWTWADFMADAKAIAASGDGIYGFNLAPDLFQGMDPWLSTNGASVLNDDWTASTVDSPAAIEAVSFARSLVAEGVVPTPGGTFDQYAALANGKLGMMGAGMWGVASFAGLGGTDDLAIAPWPQSTQNGSPMGLGAFGILEKSKKADQSWDLIRWLASPEGQDLILTLGAQPVRTSTSESEAYLSQLPKGGSNLTDALNNAELIIGVEQSGEIGTAIQDSWSQILLGSAKPEEGLSDLSDKIDSILTSQ